MWSPADADVRLQQSELVESHSRPSHFFSLFSSTLPLCLLSLFSLLARRGSHESWKVFCLDKTPAACDYQDEDIHLSWLCIFAQNKDGTIFVPYFLLNSRTTKVFLLQSVEVSLSKTLNHPTASNHQCVNACLNVCEWMNETYCTL